MAYCQLQHGPLYHIMGEGCPSNLALHILETNCCFLISVQVFHLNSLKPWLSSESPSSALAVANCKEIF